MGNGDDPGTLPLTLEAGLCSRRCYLEKQKLALASGALLLSICSGLENLNPPRRRDRLKIMQEWSKLSLCVQQKPSNRETWKRNQRVRNDPELATLLESRAFAEQRCPEP